MEEQEQKIEVPEYIQIPAKEPLTAVAEALNEGDLEKAVAMFVGFQRGVQKEVGPITGAMYQGVDGYITENYMELAEKDPEALLIMQGVLRGVIRPGNETVH